MRFNNQSQELPGDGGYPLKDIWESDLQLAVEMKIIDAFPLGILGYEMARNAAERNGKTSEFEQKLDDLRLKVRDQLVVENPSLASQLPEEVICSE